ncbi:hypothetical protein COAQ111491_14155 [Comamonas aquatilis]|uniref:hypothetical protein n=1 Tax=Comamonas aquatilis TaxID=1778406 RepID=UPI0039EE94C6
MDEAKNFMLGMMQTLKERIGNPFVGAFAAAWLVWNFKIVLVVLGKGPWEAKIKYIYKDLMPDRIDWFFHGYLIPGAVAAIWIFLLPPLFRKITVWHEKQINLNREAIYGVTEQKVLTNEEAVSLRTHILEEKTKLLDQKEKFSKSLTDHALEIQNLNSQIQNLSSEKQAAEKDKNELNNRIVESRTELNSLKESIKPKISHLDFSTVNLSNDGLHEELLSIGFNLEIRAFSRNDQFITIDKKYNYWPLIANGSLSFRGQYLLPDRTFIDESCATIIVIIHALTRKLHKKIIPISELITECTLIELPNILSSFDHLISVNLISYTDNESDFYQTSSSARIAHQFIQIGFRLNEARTSNSPKLKKLFDELLEEKAETAESISA